MSRAYDAIVDEVIAASPPVPDNLDDLTLAQHKELEHLVRRDSLSREAAHAIIRGRRQAQHAELERTAALDKIMEGIR